MKTRKKKIIITMIILLLIIIAIGAVGIISYFKTIDKTKNTKIIASKTVTEYDQTKEIKYNIKIKDYEIVNVEKEVQFSTKEEAQQEYERYQIINEYEKRNIQVKLKKKKVIITMTEQEFKEDIQYNKEYKIMLTTDTGEQREILDQDFLINFLQEQGYTIK